MNDCNGYTVAVEVEYPAAGCIQIRIFHGILHVASMGEHLVLEYAPTPTFLFVDRNNKLRGGFAHLLYMSQVRNIYRLD